MVRAAHAKVDRYWLNDPAHSDACGACKGPFPGKAVEFLTLLAGPIPV